MNLRCAVRLLRSRSLILPRTIDANSFPGTEFGRPRSNCMRLHVGVRFFWRRGTGALSPWNGGQADGTEICHSACVILPNVVLLYKWFERNYGDPLASRLSRSFKVSKTESDRSDTRDLIVVHSKHGPMLFGYRDKRRFWSKIASFHPFVFNSSRRQFPLAFYGSGAGETRTMSFRECQKIDDHFHSTQYRH